MSITGSITDFSLLEISQFIERGHRTGLLTFSAVPDSQSRLPSTHYIWVSQGNLVAAAHQLDHQGLVSLISQYQWVSDRVVTKLAQFCPPDKPLGLYLKNQGALQAEHLKHLFQVQVLQQVCPLFQLQDAQFKFDQDVSIPERERTGLSVPAGLLELTWKKLVLLQKLFEAKKLVHESSGLHSNSENLCYKLATILDITFFHSINFSLFDANHTLANLSQVVDLYYRPYDLPKSRPTQAITTATGTRPQRNGSTTSNQVGSRDALI